MNNEEQLRALAEIQKKQKQTELDVARRQALKEVDTKQAQTMPTYQQQRNNASTQSLLGAKNFAEFLANRHQTNAGISAQAEMSRANTLGNTMAGINSSEATALQGFNDQRTQAENDYTNNLTTANNTIDSTLAQNLYDEKVRQDDLAWEKQKYYTSLNQKQDKTGEINKYSNIPLAYQTGLQGVVNGNNVTYNIPNQDGSISQVTFAKGTNPFTGTQNKDLLGTDGKYNATKAFSNGYQPRYIGAAEVQKTGKTITYNGQTQNIWKTAKDTYWVWDGTQNKYVRV